MAKISFRFVNKCKSNNNCRLKKLLIHTIDAVLTKFYFNLMLTREVSNSTKLVIVPVCYYTSFTLSVCLLLYKVGKIDIMVDINQYELPAGSRMSFRRPINRKLLVLTLQQWLDFGAK